MGTHLGGRAVVVGGGMGGLFAARVLADHFDEVLVIDRDHQPTMAQPRGGVPQGSHFHVLLPGGMEAMTGWFPGFDDDLIEAGSIPMMGGRDFYAYTNEGKSYSLQSYQPEPMDFGIMYVQTRPLLELCVRRRVQSLPNVRFQYRTIVDEAIFVDGRVRGLTVRDGDQVASDLVIDASGRNSCTVRWLPAIGYEAAPETYVNCDVHYASVLLQPHNWDAFDGVVFFTMPSGTGEHGARIGTLVKLDGSRWLAGLGGRYGDAPPTDWEGFRAFGKTLPYAIWDELVDTAEPLGAIAPYRLPRAVRRHYERLDRFPEGLLPIGDASCFFNPTHGQGMSSAAGQCRGLQDVLDRRAADDLGLDGLAAEFFPVAADWVRGPWIMAAVSDFTNPNCTGDFPMEDLADLEQLGALAASLDTNPAAAGLVIGISTLQLPLSAVRQALPA